MNKAQSFKHKVFIILAGFALLMAVLYLAVNVLVAYVIEDSVLEKILAHEAETIERTFVEKGVIVQPNAEYMTLYLDINEAPHDIAKAYQEKTLHNEVFAQDGEHYHVKHLYLGKENTWLVAKVTPFLAVTNASNKILLLSVIVFFAALLLSLWLAYRISIKTTQPIINLANEVRLQLSHPKEVQFSATGHTDEIGYLATTLEANVNQLKQLLKRESDFNRDISHELRTPLTVLTNTLNLAEGRQLTPLDIEHLRKSVLQMQHTVSSLLALARAEVSAKEAFSLQALLEDIILAVHERQVEQPFDIKLMVKNDISVLSNVNLMSLLINNLIDNALQHASSNQLIIRLINNTLMFENEMSGDALPATVTELTHEKIRSDSSSGFGQGLYLSSRIIEALQMSYSIEHEGNLFTFLIYCNKKG